MTYRGRGEGGQDQEEGGAGERRRRSRSSQRGQLTDCYQGIIIISRRWRMGGGKGGRGRYYLTWSICSPPNWITCSRETLYHSCGSIIPKQEEEERRRKRRRRRRRRRRTQDPKNIAPSRLKIQTTLPATLPTPTTRHRKSQSPLKNRMTPTTSNTSRTPN